MRNAKKQAQLCVTIILLSIAPMAIFSPSVKAVPQRYLDLGHYDFDNMASSLKVLGTAVVYSLKDCNSSQGVYYFPQNTDEPDLRTIGWNDRISSLEVDGSISLYEHPNYQGRTVTFVSSQDPNENLGDCWNSNPDLNRTEGQWDTRVWGWDLSYLELMETDSGNFVNWTADGSVSSACKDSYTRAHWGACNFDQGYVINGSWVPNLVDSKQTDSSFFGDFVRSMKLQGTVTLYENVSYDGVNITLGPFGNMDGWIPDLRNPPYNWSGPAKSLHLFDGGTVTVYNAFNFGGKQLTFASPSYQPSLLRIGDAATMFLEGSVSDWYTDSLGLGSCSWTGVKFDVFAVESPTRMQDTRRVMLELYFLRQGMNLWWGPAFSKRTPDCKMVAIDCFPESVQRTVHPEDIQRWKIDLKRFLIDAGRDYSVDISRWYVAQVSFTVESGSNDPWRESPACRCELHKLRLCYTRYGQGLARVCVDPLLIESEAWTAGTTFNVSVKVDISGVPGIVGIEFALTWNASMLNATNMEEVVFHETMPPSEVEENLWQVKHVVSEDHVDYAYTYADIQRALSGGYAPITGNHTVATLTFEVKDIGECPIHFNKSLFSDINGTAVQNETIDGWFNNIPPSPALLIYTSPSLMNDTLGPNTTFSVAVGLDTIAFHGGIMGFQFKLAWNQSILEALDAKEVMYHNVTPENEWDNIWILKHQINNTEGCFSYTYAFIDNNRAISNGYAPIFGNQTLVVLTFKVKSIGSCTLHFANCKGGDAYGHAINCTVCDGVFDNMIRGDLDRNGFVDILDAITLALSFGSTPGGLYWNPSADINCDNIVDILDAIILADNFFRHYP